MKDITGQLLSNRYSIIEKIGAGGMADVYKAYCNTLNRFVAVKIIKDELKNEEESVKRFKTESRAVALLNHPNIVSVYDVGMFDGRPFIVMELIEGITLKEYMRQKGVLDYKESIFLITQVLKALDHAHTRKIIHRDIKPQNIMLLKDGAIKVADFGIARFAVSNTMTMTDSAIGTAHYLSPEQARGKITDEKSDIYSVGVMLYEMTTGEVPFDSDNPVSVAVMHLSATAKRPADINPDIPEGLEEIIIKAMSREPKNRYESASAMLEDLEMLRSDPTITFDYVYDTEEEQQAPTRKIAIKKEDEDYDYDEEDGGRISSRAQKQRISTLKKVLIAAAGVVVLIALLMNVIFPAIFNEDKSGNIHIPKLEGLMIDDVLEDKDGEYKDFEIVVVQRVNDSENEEGRIISQTPKADSVRKSGTKIEVVVSAGEKTEKVPSVAGMEYRYAKVELENKGFIVTRNESFSDTVVADNVISSSPSPDTVVPYGSEVILTVSKGRELKPVEVPNIIGMSQDSAKSAILSSGLSIGEIKQEISPRPRGEVISQTIDHGKTVDETTPIGFTISLGQELTQNLEIVLPSEPEVQKVLVTQNGSTVYEGTHKASDGRITVELKGTGTAMIGVYINDALYYEKVMRFEQE